MLEASCVVPRRQTSARSWAALFAVHVVVVVVAVGVPRCYCGCSCQFFFVGIVHVAAIIVKRRSPKHPALFVTANTSGELGLWNLNHSMEEPFAPPVKVQVISLGVDYNS